MKVFITGGTGFTGSHVLKKLAQMGVQVRCLVRNESKLGRIPASFEVVQGCLEDEAGLLRAMSGIDILINVASLGFGHAPSIVRCATAAGIKRAIFISTTSVFTRLNAPSKNARLLAEKCIEESELDYVILRPTMIYGTAEDRNICRLIRYLWQFPLLPVVGPGTHRMQPIFVQDLANVICAAAFGKSGSKKAFNVSGAQPLTFNEMIDTVAELLGHRRNKIHLPVRPIVWGLSLFERMQIRLPIKAEQILRLNEDKAFDHGDAAEAFGFQPRTFRDGVGEEIRSLGFDVND
jgi:nucleoside-diphosphate-sugar epimerase